MANQEIGFRLKADTTEAVRSVREFERAVNGIQDVEAKGSEDKGFLNENDVKRFDRMSREANRVYDRFYRNYERTQRDFERKKQELEQATSSGADKATVSNLQREYQQLERHQAMMNVRKSQTDRLQQERMDSTGNVTQMNAPGSGGGNAATFLGGFGRQAMTMLASTVAFSALFSQAKTGMDNIKIEESIASQLGNRMGDAGGDYKAFREQATTVGLEQGYTAQQSLATAEAYTAVAGSRSQDDTFADVSDIQASARAMGLNPDELATASGSLRQYGAFGDDGDQRRFANLLAGSISKQGMEGRDRELVQAISGMVDANAVGQTQVSKAQVEQLIGLQSYFGDREEGWRGQRGANLVSGIDSGIKNASSQLDILMGWGTEYMGAEDRAWLEREKENGVTSKELLSNIFTNLDRMTDHLAPEEKAAQMQLLISQEMPEVSNQDAHRIVTDPEMLDKLKNGGLDQSEIDEIFKKGQEEIDKKSDEYLQSDAHRRDQVGAEWEDTQKTGGGVIDSLFYPIAEMFSGLPNWAQWGTGIGGAVAAGALVNKGAKAVGGMLGGAKDRFSNRGANNNRNGPRAVPSADERNTQRKVDEEERQRDKKNQDEQEKDKNNRKSRGGKGFGGKALGVASRVAAPLMAAEAGDAAGNWFFGNKIGEDVNPWYNPFSNETHDTYNKGFLSKGWDWVRGKGWNDDLPDNPFAAGTEEHKERKKLLEEGHDPAVLNAELMGETEPKEVESKVKGDMTEEQDSKTNEDTSYVIEQELKLLEKQNELLDRREEIVEKESQLWDGQRSGSNDPNTTSIPASASVNNPAFSPQMRNTPGRLGLGGGMGGSNPLSMMGGMMSSLSGMPLIGGLFGAIGGAMNSLGGGNGGGGGTSQWGKSANELRNYNLNSGTQGLSAQELNSWINSKAKPGSAMYNQGDAFLKASQESGLDPRYLVAHAAHETAWGQSNIAKSKGNMYGIGAFDASPYASAYSYDNSTAGIIEGAKWIAKNYTNKGQDTLKTMRHNGGKHEYATDPQWDTKIANIMAGAPTASMNVKVSGSIGGLTPQNNNLVANALSNSLSRGGLDLAYAFTRGSGGNKS